MTDPRVPEELVEAAAGAWRPRRPDGSLGPHPAWADLDEAGRREAFEGRPASPAGSRRRSTPRACRPRRGRSWPGSAAPADGGKMGG